MVIILNAAIMGLETDLESAFFEWTEQVPGRLLYFWLFGEVFVFLFRKRVFFLFGKGLFEAF